MRKWTLRLAFLLLALLLGASVLLSGTLTWDAEQHALNDVFDKDPGVSVTLLKREKTSSGTVTEKVIPGAKFYLFKEDATQLGGELVTDSSGRISVLLEPGKYYFMEISPANGYTYDRDAEGNAIKKYPFVVAEGAKSLTVNAYNRPSDIASVEMKLPTITKLVEGSGAPEEKFNFTLEGSTGSPMPAGTKNGVKTVSRSGKGSVSLGSIVFSETGRYVYTVSETEGDGANWSYDKTEYTLEVNVRMSAGRLRCDYSIKSGGKTVDGLVFTNVYGETDPDETVTVSGEKTWYHLGNPEENRPEHIIVKVYADGKLAAQRKVTASSGWKYSFVLPKYNESGKTIIYSVDESKVEDYSKRVNGYDLINTYTGAVVTPTPEQSPKPTITPIVPVEPTPTAKPTPSVKPTTPVSPTPSVNPTTPVSPTPSVNPTTPVSPTPSVNPTTPVSPTPSVNPTTPVSPTPSVKPTTPVSPTPSVQPTTPVSPTPSVKPTTPVSPTPSAQPTTPVSPTPSVKPTTPVSPTPSVQPTTPVSPTPSVKPTTPVEPEEPDYPAKTGEGPEALAWGFVMGMSICGFFLMLRLLKRKEDNG